MLSIWLLAVIFWWANCSVSLMWAAANVRSQKIYLQRSKRASRAQPCPSLKGIRVQHIFYVEMSSKQISVSVRSIVTHFRCCINGRVLALLMCPQRRCVALRHPWELHFCDMIVSCTQAGSVWEDQNRRLQESQKMVKEKKIFERASLVVNFVFQLWRRLEVDAK